MTGGAALDYTRKMEKAVFDIANMVRETPEAVAERVKKLLADQRTLEKEIERIKAAAASEAVTDIEDAAQTVNGIRVVVKRVAVDTPAGLRDLADRFREKIQSGVVVLGSVAADKVMLIVVVTKNLTDRYHAGRIIKPVAAVVGGGGGGRPDMAQAGGSRPENLDQALEKALAVVQAV